ncbi:diacylglycerol kinase epsilon isoform X1 [Neodiprion fabricii]|uniref:diacylglycerol kinase epsilon isoform X1 n=1 Tax=Neodiprion fabricii TaxID=2872261 RepID=UPI001ED9028A|nr:diacylglycerol kinase epsilon isoform X1 [Neodiprion fabricii]XP_046428713.1 diacylglycerol kinase epsilon isoform X1 [Neodiprion fabricii]XP_046428714.1 diacylglycerol kinase epsilon isoform X1 [Neodiprion fabricii]XP_046428715.1 diacylglycerol kinase epsilon isoform X1 [Neodiprion fabricii]
MWEGELSDVILPTVSTMIIFVMTINIVRYLMAEPHIHIRDATKSHSWKPIKRISRAHFCSICESLLINVDGLYCDSCGVCADRGCFKLADKQLKCKDITLVSDQPMKHHWVKGNLPVTAMCDVCDEECETEPGLLDWWCCWCQRCVHDLCKSNLPEVCDFGKFKLMIVPPGSLEVVNTRSKMRRRLQLRKIIPPLWPNWNPIIIVANRKSGNNDGAAILSLFRRLVNPAQVVDLADRDPVAVLEWCRLLGDVSCNILVAGGDGTVAWLLNTIHKLQLKPIPSVAILPLGTGNDLSRVLGWGKEHNSDLDPAATLQQIQAAQKVDLDRWQVSVKPFRGLGFRGSSKDHFMYNYISIGVDAQVTLSFHRARESCFYLFSHRIFNKLLYLGFGTQQVVERECRDLDKKIELYLDGNKVELPSIESIVVLNIPSWGAGVDLWNMIPQGVDGVQEQSINDGKLEVVAIYSSFHMAQLQVGLSQPHHLGQASNIKIKLLGSCAVQIDGEPWYQHPCEFNISYCNRASMLKSNYN